MKINNTGIVGAYSIELEPIKDSRGQFTRWFCIDSFGDLLGGRRVVQANHSLSQKVGVIRGLHFQYPPFSEIKIVRCIRGRVFDVFVDLRKGSDTFMQTYSRELSSSVDEVLVVPEGCAHGFQVLEKNSELLYLHTACYSKEFENGIRFDDPLLKINWPIEATYISERDKNHKLIDPGFRGFDTGNLSI